MSKLMCQRVEFWTQVLARYCQRVVSLFKASEQGQRLCAFDVDTRQISFDEAAIRLQVPFPRDLRRLLEVFQALFLQIRVISRKIRLRFTSHLIAFPFQWITREIRIGQGIQSILKS